MGSPLRFQDFATDGSGGVVPHDADVEERIAKAYAEGHEAGVKAGAEASALVHAEAQDRLRAEVVEALRDHHQERVEVQAQVLAGLAPLLKTVIEQLAPLMAALGLPDQVDAALSKALETRPDPRPIIRCAAEVVPGLEPALGKWAGKYELKIDSRLTPHEVHLHWDDGFDVIDLDRTMDGILGAIEALIQSTGAAGDLSHAEQAPLTQQG